VSSLVGRHPQRIEKRPARPGSAAFVRCDVRHTSTRSAISRALGHEGRSTSRGASRVHSPHFDEMHGPESLPYRPNRASLHNPSPDDAGPSSESRIFQPTPSREAALGRSTGGKPGHRGGWKKR
jgi:excinuclease ABC subunit B